MSISAKHQESVSHAMAGLRAATSQPERALITVSRVETKFDSHNECCAPYASLSCLQLVKQEAPDLQITSYFTELRPSASPFRGLVSVSASLLTPLFILIFVIMKPGLWDHRFLEMSTSEKNDKGNTNHKMMSLENCITESSLKYF